MNYIWCLMIIVSIVVSIFNGTVDQTINGAFEGAKSAVFTVLSQKLEKLLKPIINFLFPNAGQNAKKYIAVNMSANILGMGNAATPMGIKAMQCLDKENNNPLYTSKNMCMLVVLNTTSVQLIPTTIIALRVASGSANPFSVILPIWISSFTAAFIALTLTKLLYRE